MIKTSSVEARTYCIQTVEEKGFSSKVIQLLLFSYFLLHDLLILILPFFDRSTILEDIALKKVWFISILFTYMSACKYIGYAGAQHSCLVPVEARRGCWIHRSYRELLPARWVLGTESRYSARAPHSSSPI